MNTNEYIHEQSSELSAPFCWWPPDFPGVHLSEGEKDQQPVSDPAGADDLGTRLAQSYETIDQQRDHISQLVDRVTQLENAVDRANERTRRTRRRWSLLVKSMVLLPCLGTGVIFHREVAQVGWNFFCGACDVLALAPANAAGLLTATAVAVLLWKVAKATFRAALEDLFDREAEGEE